MEINEGGMFAGNGSFSDPGADTWLAPVDYGDGSGAQALSLAADKTFALNHSYAANGMHRRRPLHVQPVDQALDRKSAVHIVIEDGTMSVATAVIEGKK